MKRHLPLLTALLLATLAAAAEPAYRTMPVGQATLSLLADGRWSLTAPGRPPVTSAYLVIAAQGWKGSVSQSALQRTGEPVTEGAAVVMRGTLTEPSTKTVWRLEQRVEPVGEAFRLSYDLAPETDTTVGEISLFCDLPIDAWQGQTIVLDRAGRALFPVLPPKARHFLAGRARRVCLAGGEPPTSLTFSPAAACTVQDTREFKNNLYQFYARLPVGGEVKAGHHARLEVVVKPSDPAGLPKEPSYRSVAPLHVGAVKLPAAAFPCSRRFELPLDVTGTWTTPFDADQIRVDAHVRTPAGRNLIVPAFYTQPYRLLAEEGGLSEPAGEPGWRLRFSATEAGRHTLFVTATDRSGEQRSPEVAFEATASADPGCVRVSRTDPHYFAFDNGRPYFAVGENMATGQALQYDTWLRRLGQAGGNYARVWMCSSCFGIEYGPPGIYRLDAAADLDHVFELAEQHGIYIKLCLEAWRGFTGEGSFLWGGAIQPYDRRNGGPCAKEMDFFSNAEARRMWQNRLRYVIARWGSSTHVLAWEFWNEIDCVYGYQQRSQEVVDWSAIMADYLHQHDPWNHLVVNSLGSFVQNDRLWSLPQLDFAQVHGYWHPTLAASKDVGKDMGAMVPLWLGKIRGFGKPALFAECGLVNERWGPSPLSDQDREGVALHDMLWAGLAAGGCGTAMIWWHDNQVDKYNLYPQLTPVAKFAADVPWTTAGFQPVELTASDPAVRALALVGRDRALLWLQNRAHTWWNVVQKQPVPPVKPATIPLTGLPDGDYTLEWWDTWTGQVTRTESGRSAGGKLALEVTGLAKDVAVKVTRR